MPAGNFADWRGVIAAALVVLLSQSARSSQSARPVLQPDPPKRCSSCVAWNLDLEPFQLYGNTYYVGTAALGALLVTSPDGHILLDAGLPQTAALVDAHVRKLGFRTEDIKFILTSHAHYDHVGGVAALQRFTGATVVASASTAAALANGRPTADDPQFAIPENDFPAVTRVKIVRDGETIRLGALAITAHLTPGHTPGSTTWSWQSCQNARCLPTVYVDSLNAVSADDFRFSGDAKSPSRADAFRKSIAAVDALPCDVLMSVHPSFAGLDEKLARRAITPAVNPFIDADACHKYAANARQTLDARLAKERQSKREDREP
jgi:metallo-beta-lactamase class B